MTTDRPISDCLAEVQQRIAAACARAGRKLDEVEVIGVTKTFGPDLVTESWLAGLRKLGEKQGLDTHAALDVAQARGLFVFGAVNVFGGNVVDIRRNPNATPQTEEPENG